MANNEHERTVETWSEDRKAVAVALYLAAWHRIGTCETPQQRARTARLISNDKILQCLGEVADLPPHQRHDARTARIDEIVRFIEEVATLPDQQPPGSHFRSTARETLFFSSPTALKHDLGEAHTEASALIDVIKRTAPTLQGQFPLNDTRQLIELLERFSSSAVNELASFAERAQIDRQAKTERQKSKDYETPTEGTPARPGLTAGKNNTRNWLIQKTGQLAVIHLGGRYEDLVSEVARVLRGDEQSTNARTIRDMLPNVTLTPAKDEWRLGDDWRKQLDP